MPKAFVVSATGNQGSALCRILLSEPYTSQQWTVSATTRDTSSPAALALAKLGVDLTQADWDNKAALETAMQGCTHLFLNLMPNIAAMTSELPWAEVIIEIAGRVGVKHVVYSGAYSPKTKQQHHDDNTNVGGENGTAGEANPAPTSRLQQTMARVFAGKSGIETLVLGLISSSGTKTSTIETATVLLPGFFALNLLKPMVDFMYPTLVSTRVWTTALEADTPIPVVDTFDIAQFAAMVFADPEKFNGKRIPIWSELLTPGEMVDQLGAVVRELEMGGAEGAAANEKEEGKKTKKVFEAEFYTPEQVEQRLATDMFVNVQLMMRDLGRDAAKEHPVEKYGVQMTGFRGFLERERELVRQAYCA